MLVSIPPYLNIAQFIRFLKSKGVLTIFDRYTSLKYRYERRNFWWIGRFVNTVEGNEKAIKGYIKNQLKENDITDQISWKEYTDLLMGSREE